MAHEDLMLKLPDQILILRKDLGKFYIASDYLYGTTGEYGIEILDGDMHLISPQAKPWCCRPEFVIPITTPTKSLSDE